MPKPIEGLGLRMWPAAFSVVLLHTPSSGGERYLQMMLLTDLQSPWLALKLPQALPGIAALSKFTRPTFMRWRDSGLEMVCGLWGPQTRIAILKS